MAREPDTITRIAVRGFKSIAEQQAIDIRPLTLLAGANSSGKSSLMQPLLLLKQTLEAAGDPGALLLDGPNVRFTQAEQLLCTRSPAKHDGEFAVRIDFGSIWVESVFQHVAGAAGGFEVKETKCRTPWWDVAIRRGMPADQILTALPPALRDLRLGLAQPAGEQIAWSVGRDRCFLCFTWAAAGADLFRGGSPPLGTSPSETFSPHIRGVIHVAGLRGNPQRNYPKQAVGSAFPGTFEGYVASLVAVWQKEDPARLRRLGRDLQALGLTWKVKAKPVDDTQVELMVGRLPYATQGGAHDLVSIADVGFGVSQSLPVVVALVAARPGQTVYLEQPEIHLHPRAQRQMAHLLAMAAKRGVRVIAETHSAMLLREVQTLVAKGDLDKDIVKLHWFQRGDDGCTTVSSADLDDNGAYGPWPEDFDDVALDAESAYLDAVETRSIEVAEGGKA